MITAAELITVFVFGSFGFEDQRAIKMFGLGLAEVAADASLVRMLIVPFTMELLGVRNWWLPGWLARTSNWQTLIEIPKISHEYADFPVELAEFPRVFHWVLCLMSHGEVRFAPISDFLGRKADEFERQN